MTANLPATPALQTTVDPVIIIGMHRSGTSLVAQLLEDMGLFVGWKKQGDYEAVFFLSLNEWIMSQCGARWDHPEPVQNLVQHERVRELAADYLGVSLRSTRALSFLGPSNATKISPLKLSGPWGWKDPRTTYTLPLWLDLFPRARVLHVGRHGVDVADSLVRRHNSSLSKHGARYEKVRLQYLLRSRPFGFTNGVGFSSMDEAFALWEKYMAIGRTYATDAIDRGLGLDVCYEDLLTNPQDHLSEIAKFCQLDPSEQQLADAASRIRPDRAFAHRSNPELVAFADTVAEPLRTYGYE